MVFFARWMAPLMALVVTLPLAGAGPAAAQESGGNFFSRFIPGFGSAPAATPAPAGKPSPAAPNLAMPNPVTKPGAVEAASDPTEANPFAGGGGGLIAMMNGHHSTACDGVVCMFTGGGETKGAPEAPVAPAPQAAAFARANPVDDRVSPRKERCTAPANDPWRCYR